MVREDENREITKSSVEKIKKAIGYTVLVQNYAEDKEIIDEIAELIYETLIGEGETIVIASNVYPVRLVKEKFMKLEYDHVAYILECLKNNTISETMKNSLIFWLKRLKFSLLNVINNNCKVCESKRLKEERVVVKTLDLFFFFVPNPFPFSFL